MGTWNRRKKYSIEGAVTKGEQSKIKLQLSKLVKRELYLTMLSIAAVTLIIIGSTYAVFSSVNQSKDYNVINVGTLEISYEDTGNGLGDIIKLNNAFPVSDSEGMAGTGYKFKITNVGSLGANYTISVMDDQAMIDADGCVDNILPKSNLKFSLNNSSAKILGDTLTVGEDLAERYVLSKGYLDSSESASYDLKMWIAETAGNEILGKHFHGKIVVEMIPGGEKPTPASCFDFDESTGAITLYKCGTKVWNGSGLVTATADNLPDGIGSPITDVVIPKTINGVAVTKIEASSENIPKGLYPFSYQSTGMGITSVVFPEGLKEIGKNSFYGNQLTSVIIPNSVTTIGEGAFAYNQSTNAVIPNSVTTIESGAFFNNQLTSVTIPNSITTIGAKAFSYNQLTNITIPNSVTTIGDNAFSYNQLTNAVIPNSVTTIGYEAFNNNQLPDSQAFIYARNSDETEDKTTIIGYGGAKRDNVIIPEGVTTIGASAFRSNQLTSVTIPNSVTTIGEGAFGYNQLTNITIPNNVTSIESSAFFNNQLTSVTIPNSITIIGAKAFGYNQLTNITIPNSVTTIGNFAFMYNRLTSVTIPDSVTTIEASAFSYNQLTSVIIQGKSSSADFTSYPSSTPFGWADGYSDSNITWNG